MVDMHLTGWSWLQITKTHGTVSATTEKLLGDEIKADLRVHELWQALH